MQYAAQCKIDTYRKIPADTPQLLLVTGSARLQKCSWLHVHDIYIYILAKSPTYSTHRHPPKSPTSTTPSPTTPPPSIPSWLLHDYAAIRVPERHSKRLAFSKEELNNLALFGQINKNSDRHRIIWNKRIVNWLEADYLNSSLYDYIATSWKKRLRLRLISYYICDGNPQLIWIDDHW